MSETTIPVLYYGSVNRRRRLLRRILFVLVLTIAVLAAKRYGPQAWRKSSELYWQRWCLNYVGPADAGPPMRTPDRFLRLFEPRRGHGFWRDEDYSDRQMLFLHGRRARGGPERLVIVYGELDSGRPPRSERVWQPEEQLFWLLCRAHVMSLASCSESFPGDSEGAVSSKDWSIAVAKRVRLFNGQPDPADPSRFTIIYEVDGQRGSIEGRLNSDDTVRLRIVDGPAKPVDPDE